MIIRYVFIIVRPPPTVLEKPPKLYICSTSLNNMLDLHFVLNKLYLCSPTIDDRKQSKTSIPRYLSTLISPISLLLTFLKRLKQYW